MVVFAVSSRCIETCGGCEPRPAPSASHLRKPSLAGPISTIDRHIARVGAVHLSPREPRLDTKREQWHGFTSRIRCPYHLLRAHHDSVAHAFQFSYSALTNKSMSPHSTCPPPHYFTLSRYLLLGNRPTIVFTARLNRYFHIPRDHASSRSAYPSGRTSALSNNSATPIT